MLKRREKGKRQRRSRGEVTEREERDRAKRRYEKKEEDRGSSPCSVERDMLSVRN